MKRNTVEYRSDIGVDSLQFGVPLKSEKQTNSVPVPGTLGH